jgi:hypothetical protein
LHSKLCTMSTMDYTTTERDGEILSWCTTYL